MRTTALGCQLDENKFNGLWLNLKACAQVPAVTAWACLDCIMTGRHASGSAVRPSLMQRGTAFDGCVLLAWPLQDQLK